MNAVSAEKAEPETQESAMVNAPAAPAGGSPAAQSATLNSVQQVQEYRFNPDRYQDYDAGHSGWWAIEAVKLIKVQKLWAKMETSLKLWVTSFSTTTGRLGSELRHQVMRQNGFVLSWTEGAIQDMAGPR